MENQKYKIKARSISDWVEIGPFNSFKEALDNLFNDHYMMHNATIKQSYQTSIETQSHPLITLVTGHE